MTAPPPDQRSAFTRFVDRCVEAVSPGRALRREHARAMLTGFRALGAYSNDGRPNANPGMEGETQRTSRERVQLMWNALELIDNSALAESITSKLSTYLFGMLRYQARTGDKYVNQAYEDLMRDRCGPSLDITGRFSLREMMQISERGRIVKGGAAFDWVRPYQDCPNIFLRGIEYDRIGNPYYQPLERGKVGGVHIDGMGREIAFDIYNRDRVGGMYSFAEMVPKWDDYGNQQFIHIFKPTNFDQYKGTTVFKTAIDLVHYLDQMRKFELQAMHWAASQSGVYYTENRELPPQTYGTRTNSAGESQRTFQVTPNTVQAIGTAEKVEMFKNDRPSANVQAYYLNVVREIALATELPYGIVYDAGDAGGPGIRFEGAQADRVISSLFAMYCERALNGIADMILGNAIFVERSVPYHPLWKRGRWMGPRPISIDAGYDSAAMLNELDEGVRSMAGVCAELGEDQEEIMDQKEIETDNLIGAAQRIAKKRGIEMEVALAYLKRGANASGGAAGVAKGTGGADGLPALRSAEDGATSDGTLV